MTEEELDPRVERIQRFSAYGFVAGLAVTLISLVLTAVQSIQGGPGAVRYLLPVSLGFSVFSLCSLVGIEVID